MRKAFTPSTQIEPFWETAVYFNAQMQAELAKRQSRGAVQQLNLVFRVFIGLSIDYMGNRPDDHGISHQIW